MLQELFALQKMKYEVHTKLPQIAYQIQIWYATLWQFGMNFILHFLQCGVYVLFIYI